MDPIQIIIQVLLALVVASVGFIVKGLSNDIKKFSQDIVDIVEKLNILRIDMVKDFALKDDLIPIKQRMSELLSLADMTLLRAQVQKLGTDVSALQANIGKLK